MLFKVYSRYVPNLMRQDGSAMGRLLASRLAIGQVIRMEEDREAGLRPVQTDLYAPDAATTANRTQAAWHVQVSIRQRRRQQNRVTQTH